VSQSCRIFDIKFLKQNQSDALISQIYFWNRTVHVSESLSVQHHESSTVHTAIGICHTGYVDCLLAGSGWIRMDPDPASLTVPEIVISDSNKCLTEKNVL
jgi:hypothetical protein